MAFFDRLLRGNILFYPGCLSKYVLNEIADNYATLLLKIGINFKRLDSEVCCGSPVINAGYRHDFLELREKNLKLFEENKISKIITNCPSCYRIFKEEYNFDVEHVTQVILKNIDRFKKLKEEDITYHDPCHLGRNSNIISEPRLILDKLGYNVIELEKNMERAICCGAGAGLKANLPEVSNKIAMLTLDQVKTDKLVTTCPMCYLHFKQNSKNIKIMELSQCLSL